MVLLPLVETWPIVVSSVPCVVAYSSTSSQIPSPCAAGQNPHHHCHLYGRGKKKYMALLFAAPTSVVQTSPSNVFPFSLPPPAPGSPCPRNKIKPARKLRVK